jgi:Uncharacterized protein conserved in bacteria (DUF2184)
MNIRESRAEFLADRDYLISKGIAWQPGAEPYAYVPSMDVTGAELDAMAMDALPSLSTDPNAGIPTMITTWIDPDVYNVVFAPLRAAEIIGDERRRGDWTLQTAMFPVSEQTGEVKTYGDFDDGGGEAGVNYNWPQRQSYLFQSVIEWGDLETARLAEARMNLVSDKQKSRARQLATFLNFSYFYGIGGLQCYGMLNDPNLSASLTPAAKAYGGTAWMSGNNIRATANEIVLDIQAMFSQLVSQTGGLIDTESEMTLALAPQLSVALTAVNSFNVNVRTLLANTFRKLRIETAVQYGPVAGYNPQGQNSGLNLVQLIATEVSGQRTAFCGFNEKLRAHRIVPMMSAFKQKATSGTWGTIIRFPPGIASMVGC